MVGPPGGVRACWYTVRVRLDAMRRWQVPTALFLLGVGFLMAVMVRTREPIREAAALPSWRLQELAVLVKQQEDARAVLEAEVEALMRRVQEYEAAVMEGRGLTEAMEREMARYRLVLGLVPVSGPGVVVVVSDEPGGRPIVLPVAVEATDLYGLVNELMSAGAEAIAINGVRILANSGIRATAAGMVVEGKLLRSPYTIEAIGDPAALAAVLSVRGGFVEGLGAVGIRISVSPRERLTLPPREGATPFHLARPKDGQ